MKRGKNLTGKTFGMLTVLEWTGARTNNGTLIWRCKCDCGGITEIQSASLNAGVSTSCGCKTLRTGEIHPLWKGVGKMSSSYFNSLKKNAIRRNIIFTITKEEAYALFVKQNGRCALSNESLTFPDRYANFDGTASIDRINSELGYIKENIQWVHKDVNFAKQKKSNEEFIEMCRKVVKMFPK